MFHAAQDGQHRRVDKHHSRQVDHHQHAAVAAQRGSTRRSSGTELNALVAVARQARADGGEVRLVVTGAAVADLVALTGVDRVIPVSASLEGALA